MMSEILPFLVLILVLGILSSLPLYLLSQERRANQRLGELAVQRGWSLREHPTTRRAYIFKDREEPWEIDLYRSGSQHPALTVWRSILLQWSDNPVLIISKLEPHDLPDQADLLEADRLRRTGGELLTRTAGWGTLPAPGPWGLLRLGIAPSDLSPQPCGSEQFRQSYSVLASSAASAQRLLSPQVEAQLLEWPELDKPMQAPILLANQEGVSIRLPHDQAVQQPELFDRLVRLGAALSEAVQAFQPGQP